MANVIVVPQAEQALRELRGEIGRSTDPQRLDVLVEDGVIGVNCKALAIEQTTEQWTQARTHSSDAPSCNSAATAKTFVSTTRQCVIAA
jgi:hypothetical protein